MADSQDDKSVTDLLKEILNEAVLDLHRVDPETKGALLTGTLDIIINDTSGLKLLLCQLLQAMLAVENGRDEDRVNLCIALADILRSQAVLNTHRGGILDHFCRSFDIISLLKSIKRAFGIVKLIQDIDQFAAIFEICAQVCNLRLASSPKVEVHPADENLLRLELLEVGKLLAVV